MVNVRNVKIKFAEELKSRMLERGVTYRQAALAVGVTKGAFVHYKSGNCFPELFVLVRIANYLNCSVDELLGYISGRTMRLNKSMNDDFSDEDEFKDYFRERLISMMTEKNLGVNELARKSRVSIDTIEMYLSIHRWVPCVIDFLYICDALDCTPSDLLGY